MLFTDVQRSVRLNKKKKSTNTSPYPDEVIDRLARAFYPAILACWNSEEGQRELLHGRRNRLITPLVKKNRAFLTGNALLYISLSYVDFLGCVRVGAPFFCFIFFKLPDCLFVFYNNVTNCI